MPMIDFLLTAVAIVAVVPAGLLAVELLVGLPRRRIALLAPPPAPRTVIVMPAHNEASVIGDTIARLKPQLAANVRLLVVADNCTDDTAAIARAAGADVVERQNANARGKGYALDHGIRHLAADPPEVVVILDADCQVSPDGIRRLAHAAHSRQLPVQGQYLFEPHPDAGIGQSIATFALRLKNANRPMGLSRLGAPCPLTGTGMAFPWEVIEAAEIGSGNIVEDMKLGVDLTRAGKPPLYLPEVMITSPFPRTDAARTVQQQRWEHGHLDLMRGEGIPLLLHGLRTRHWASALNAVDLMIPPVTLLLALLGAGFLGAAVLAILGVAFGPLGVIAAALLAVVGSIALSWHVHGRGDMPARALATVPRFALAKVKVYASYLLGRRSGWVRTDRS